MNSRLNFETGHPSLTHVTNGIATDKCLTGLSLFRSMVSRNLISATV